MTIFCTRCRRQQQAHRCSVLAKPVGGRRPQRLWANRCTTCGTAHVAPDPTRAPARQAARKTKQTAAQMEAAGQLQLFRKVGGAK